jgi:hypothetical protein
MDAEGIKKRGKGKMQHRWRHKTKRQVKLLFAEPMFVVLEELAEEEQLPVGTLLRIIIRDALIAKGLWGSYGSSSDEKVEGRK